MTFSFFNPLISIVFDCCRSSMSSIVVIDRYDSSVSSMIVVVVFIDIVVIDYVRQCRRWSSSIVVVRQCRRWSSSIVVVRQCRQWSSSIVVVRQCRQWSTSIVNVVNDRHQSWMSSMIVVNDRSRRVDRQFCWRSLSFVNVVDHQCREWSTSILNVVNDRHRLWMSSMIVVVGLIVIVVVNRCRWLLSFVNVVDRCCSSMLSTALWKTWCNCCLHQM